MNEQEREQRALELIRRAADSLEERLGLFSSVSPLHFVDGYPLAIEKKNENEYIATLGGWEIGRVLDVESDSPIVHVTAVLTAVEIDTIERTTSHQPTS